MTVFFVLISEMESDSEVENVISDQIDPSIFTHVPFNKDYKFKIDSKKLTYTLKQGKELPYSTALKGQYTTSIPLSLWLIVEDRKKGINCWP